MAARSLNKVMIIGNLTRDPELRYTPKGTPVVSFGVATNREWRASEETERREETEFHNVTAWSKLAELCNQLLKKGMKVYIEGRLSTHSWEDSTTKKRMYRTEIVADEMMILSYPKGSTPPSSSNSQTEEVKEGVVGEEAPAVEESLETTPKEELKDIPF